MIYRTSASALTLDGMKFISWFDQIKAANAGHQGFTHALFLRISMPPYFVINVQSTEGRGKSNLHFPVAVTPYLKHVALCDTECICRFETITLLFSSSCFVKSTSDLLVSDANGASNLAGLASFSTGLIDHLMMWSMNFTIQSAYSGSKIRRFCNTSM